jgi:orotate phosphoribosyltransferase-like protein
MITLEQERKFIELRSKGWSFDKIAQELGISKPTLMKLNQKYIVRITKQKELELDDLMEIFHLSKMKKVELVGIRLQSIREALEERNLNSLPTVELMKLEEKFLKIGNDILN